MIAKFRIYKDTSSNLCLILLIFELIVGFLTFILGLPDSLYYIGDLLNITLIVLCSRKIIKALRTRHLRPVFILMCLWIGCGLISGFVYGFHFALWIWSIRNWCRLFTYMFVCIVILDKNKIDRIINFFIKLYHLNFIIILIQFYVFNIKGDMLNGLVGWGTSGALINFIMIILATTYSYYFTQKGKLPHLMIVTLESMIIATLAELKAVFIFIIIMFVFYMLINSKNSVKKLIRNIAIISLIMIGLVVFAQSLGKIYPQFAGFLNLDYIINSITTEEGYGNTGYIDRLTGIQVINEHFFDSYGTFYRLFGIGSGNAEYSAFSALRSAFYNGFGEKFHYLNFSSVILYLENGIVGMLLYASIFVYLLIYNVRRIRKFKLSDRVTKREMDVNLHDMNTYYNIGAGLALTCLCFFVYNNVQRTDISFLLAFFIAIPLAIEFRVKTVEGSRKT